MFGPKSVTAQEHKCSADNVTKSGGGSAPSPLCYLERKDIMPEYTANAPQTVPAGQNVLLTETPITCNRGYVCHRNGSGIVTLRGITNQCRARYRVSADGNIAVAAGGTAGAISVSLAITGEPLNSATAIVTPAAVGDLFNVHVEAIIDVPKGCCLTIALENTSTQAITAQNVNVIVDRVA